MRRVVAVVALALVLIPSAGYGQQEESYDYWRFNRDMIRNGQQAIFMCNGAKPATARAAV